MSHSSHFSLELKQKRKACGNVYLIQKIHSTFPYWKIHVIKTSKLPCSLKVLMDYQIDILEKLYNMSSATFSCGFAELVFSANNRGRCQTLHQKRSKVKTRKEKQLR